MGILRTDKLSGLETPTPVTGSVAFDGSDYLAVTPTDQFEFGGTDFTIEMWVNITSTSGLVVSTFFSKGNNGSVSTEFMSLQTTGNNTIPAFFFRSGSALVSGSSLELSKWYHLAVTRSGNTFRLFVDGKLVDSATNSNDLATGVTGGVSVSGQSYDLTANNRKFIGSLSNVRILKGTALYTSDFTVPTHALEVIGDTVLLCCNNPDSVGADGTGKTITASGDPTVSTDNPSLTRDFTSGTEFSGVTVFDTQGYFVPPSGTTEQRDSSGGRGIIAGTDNGIHYITISTFGNSQDFGDLTYSAPYSAGCASHTRGLIAGGFNSPTGNNTINAITISTTGNAINFGDIPQTAIYGMGGCSSSTRGLFGGGFKAPSPNADAGLLQINYVTIASLGDAGDFGDLVFGVRYPSGTSSPTRGLFAAGRDSANAPVFNRNKIDYVTIATTGNATDFGDLTDALYSMAGTGSATRGLFAGGYNPAGGAINLMNYVTIATTGNAQDFGDLSLARGGASASSNPTRATFAGGSNPSAQNVIDYVEIQSTGNALNFGDLYSTRYAAAGFSNSHGGLS